MSIGKTLAFIVQLILGITPFIAVMFGGEIIARIKRRCSNAKH